MSAVDFTTVGAKRCPVTQTPCLCVAGCLMQTMAGMDVIPPLSQLHPESITVAFADWEALQQDRARLERTESALTALLVSYRSLLDELGDLDATRARATAVLADVEARLERRAEVP